MFERIKHLLGIGGVTVELELPAAISHNGTSFQGMAKLTSKSTLHINSVTIKLIEEFVVVSGDGMEVNTLKEHGRVDLGDALTINVGEVVELPFTLDYHIPEPEAKTNAAGLLVQRTGDYFVTVYVDVAETPTLFDPGSRAGIRVE